MADRLRMIIDDDPRGIAELDRMIGNAQADVHIYAKRLENAQAELDRLRGWRERALSGEKVELTLRPRNLGAIR